MAYQIVINSSDFKPKWTAAVEWLNDELERVKFLHLYIKLKSSNTENRNTPFYQACKGKWILLSSLSPPPIEFTFTGKQQIPITHTITQGLRRYVIIEMRRSKS